MGTEGQGVEHIRAAKARGAIDFLLCYQATEISPAVEKRPTTTLSKGNLLKKNYATVLIANESDLNITR